MIMRLFALLAAVLLAMGCTSTSFRNVPVDSLLLRAELTRDRVVENTELALNFVLENSGQEQAAACLSESWTYIIIGTTDGGGSGIFVDHPSCKLAFDLAPGETARWSKTISIPAVGLGPARVKAEVDVLPLGSCGKYGCSTHTLESEWAEFLVVAEK